MEDCGPKIIDVTRVFRGTVAQFIGGSIDAASLETSTCNPKTESERIVIPAITALGKGSSAKFPSKNHDGLIQ